MAKKDAKNKHEEETTIEKIVEETPTDESSEVHDHVHVEICRNSEYIQHVRELAEVLETFFPHLDGHIQCIHYEVAQWRIIVSWIFGILPFLGFIFLIAGEYIMNYIYIPQGLEVMTQMRDSRAISLLVMLLLGCISKYLVTPAAFEIYYNDELVFSKLENNRWCTTEEILGLLKAKGLKKLEKKD